MSNTVEVCSSCKVRINTWKEKDGAKICIPCTSVIDVLQEVETKKVICLKCDQSFVGSKLNRICNFCKNGDERKYLAGINNGIH